MLKPEQLALSTGETKPKGSWYCGAVIAYQGDGKWSLGLVIDTPPEEERQVEWIKGVDFATLQKLLDSQSKRIVRKTDGEIHGYTETKRGPH